MEHLTIAVLSDLHAAPHNPDPSAPEVKLFSDGGPFAIHDHPLTSLHDLIRKDTRTAEIVICPGDMTNHADPGALAFIWAGLHSLTSQLRAKHLLATVGNHDLESRAPTLGDFPREHLMKLSPRFPVANDAKADHYWAHGYYITAISGIRFLVLNSCWLHEARDDLKRGAITAYTLEKIRRDLETASGRHSLNVAICHHHPHQHSELRLGEDDIMRNGQQFLDLIMEHGSWLVVHGHKHHPKIEYSAGQIQQPIVFAAGSFSGRLEGPNASVSRNYFHEIDISTHAATVKGRIRSWAWAFGLGWRKYSDTDWKFPCEFGFGFQGDIQDLGNQVRNQLAGKSIMGWPELCKRVDNINFLMPRQMQALIRLVESTHSLKIVYDDYGQPTEIGRRLP